MINNQDTGTEDAKLKCYNHNEDDYKSGSDWENDVEEEHCYSDDDKHINNEKTVDYFIDENVWDKIGKELKDYDENDMDLLKWKTLEDCIEFYNTYAKVKGFGVRLGQSVKSRKDGHFISKKLLCRKEGHREEKWMNLPIRKKKEKPISRVGCQAHIKFRFDEQYQYWKVENFHAEHNHEMVKATHVSYIRSFRKISELDKIKIKSMHNSGIAPNRMMRQFVNEAGSIENVGFISKDLYNFLDRIKREEVQDGDAETVMAYLYGKQESDPYFFVSYTRDECGNLEKLFWCDSISRNDYKEFGQVLAFDTTYKCNAYNKPFVILVGVNHHQKTVPFGCALVVNERVDTYVWVLEQLIAAGDGYKPLTVITDRDKAMANAISKVLPEAKHRLCLWHIMRNIKQNGNNNNSFHDGFMRCADSCRTPKDFEQAWNELIDKHKVGEKRWVKELYEDKEKWAEAYLRGYFYAGMRTTQRCESMNKTVKRLLDRKVMLYRFIDYYHKELQSLRWEEGRQDYRTMDEQPYCDGVLATLKSNAARVYTRNAFATLCKEMSYEGYYLVKQMELKDECIYYWVEHVEKEKLYILVRNSTHDTMYCCCMKFESVGFPCRHMFAVLKYEKAKEIPRGCILKRWTIHAKRDVGLEKKNEDVEDDNSTTVQARYSNLASYCMTICRRAAQTYKTFNEVKDQFAKMTLKLQSVKVGCKKRITKSGEFLGIGDPVVLESGRGKPKRTKRQASSSIPPRVPCDEDDDVSLEVHKTFELSLNKACDQDMVHTDVHELLKLAAYMPDTYEKDDISKASYGIELKKMEKNPTIFDWQPNKDWFLALGIFGAQYYLKKKRFRPSSPV
ncbi:hypothetical protein GQ457_01G049760 [Hibiscus cannabinus]